MSRALLYGATGYTGRAIAQTALAGEMDLVLAGRNPEALRAVAEPLGLPWRAFPLGDPQKRSAAVSPGSTPCSMPPGRLPPRRRRCSRRASRAGRTTSIVGGEWRVIEALFARDAEARARQASPCCPAQPLTPAAMDCLLLAAVERWPRYARACGSASRRRKSSRAGAWRRWR
jgi:NAD(P)-dependent dehydrogenase (short-subunit alcohol dehydrogenase family)